MTLSPCMLEQAYSSSLTHSNSLLEAVTKVLIAVSAWVIVDIG